MVTNGPRVSHNDYLKTIDGYVVFDGNKYKILGHIHSHPNSHDSGPKIPDDFYMLTNYNIPIFTIGTGGVHQGIIGDDGNMYNIFLGNRQLFLNGTFSITDYLD